MPTIKTPPAEISLPHEETLASFPQAQAMGMFLAAIVFLFLLALAIPHPGFSVGIGEIIWETSWVPRLLLILWAVIAVEALWSLRSPADNFRWAALRFLLVLLLPPFRIAVTPSVPTTVIWLPRGGWQRSDQVLFEKLEWRSTIPMLIVTLLILPVVGIEFLFQDSISESPGLMIGLHVVNALIWFAFALEFILMVSVTERKLAYCKQNWINILIIVLPLIGFLRTIRLFKVLRVAKVGKLLRAYRLRGLMMRVMRIALILNLLERFMRRNPEKYLASLREKEQEKMLELDDIRAKIQAVQEIIAERDTVK